MRIKLIAIDMDGTLLQPDHRVSAAVKAALQEARMRGIRIVLATGRPYSGVRDYLAELKMQTADDFCITYNGALLQQGADGTVLAQKALNYTDYRQIEAWAKQTNCHFHVLDQQTLYTADRQISRYTVHESFLTHVPLVYCEAENMPAETQLLKMMLIDDPEIIDRAQQQIPDQLKQQYTVIRSSPYFIEFMHKSASKGKALQQLAEKLTIAPGQIMAIGDQQNDLAMLQYAGISVAMGNAPDSVKALTTRVTKTNTEDGVAYAIEQWAL